MNLDLAGEFADENEELEDPIPFFFNDVHVADARWCVGTRGSFLVESDGDIDYKITSLNLVKNKSGRYEIRAYSS